MAPVLTFAMTAAITPGPNNIILSTNAVNYGFKETIPLMMGVFFGFLSVLTLCLLGIGELYKSFPAIAMIVKIVDTFFPQLHYDSRCTLFGPKLLQDRG